MDTNSAGRSYVDVCHENNSKVRAKLEKWGSKKLNPISGRKQLPSNTRHTLKQRMEAQMPVSAARKQRSEQHRGMVEGKGAGKKGSKRKEGDNEAPEPSSKTSRYKGSH